MPLEVEMKARVKRPGETLPRIERLCRFTGEYLKEDLYFHSPAGIDPVKDIRLRRQGGGWICTRKTRSLRGGLEVNDETEFTVSDGPAFALLLEEIGCRIFLRKTKKGKSYSFDGLTVEVSEVPPLGLFVEAECLLDAPAPEDVAAAEERIRGFLAGVGIREDDIESRTYAEMLLRAAGGGA